MRELILIRPGIQSTIQDLGRSGMRHLGVSQSGALDPFSLILANRLLENPPALAGLELVAGPIELEFTCDTWFALSGAPYEAHLAGKQVATGWRNLARAGQRLLLRGPLREARAYLAVAGGLDVPLLLGARATDLQAGFGGWQGRALRVGDRIPIGAACPLFKPIGIQQRPWNGCVRILPGLEFAHFSPTAKALFFEQRWKVRPQSNRMGYRLEGPPLERTTQKELLSHGVLPGVIQVPPNGQPIVLLAESQTTGGYPKIATVIEADLWKVAQTPIGQCLSFEQTDRATALEASKKWQHELARLDWMDWMARD